MEDPGKYLLDFFKALADSTRLKIIGLLAQQPYSVEELAALVDLRPSTVSHHLARLSAVGLVSARSESYYNVYALEKDALEDAARRLLSTETISAAAADINLSAYDQKVLETYVRPDGSFKGLPRQQKKLLALLGYLAMQFEAGRDYSEAEVNAIIGRCHEDIAGLRRDLVDYHFLTRDKRGMVYRKGTRER